MHEGLDCLAIFPFRKHPNFGAQYCPSTVPPNQFINSSHCSSVLQTEWLQVQQSTVIITLGHATPSQEEDNTQGHCCKELLVSIL